MAAYLYCSIAGGGCANGLLVVRQADKLVREKESRVCGGLEGATSNGWKRACAPRTVGPWALGAVQRREKQKSGFHGGMRCAS